MMKMGTLLGSSLQKTADAKEGISWMEHLAPPAQTQPKIQHTLLTLLLITFASAM